MARSHAIVSSSTNPKCVLNNKYRMLTNIHILGLKITARIGSKGVVADAADHGRAGAEARCHHTLVCALAPKPGLCIPPHMDPARFKKRPWVSTDTGRSRLIGLGQSEMQTHLEPDAVDGLAWSRQSIDVAASAHGGGCL